MVFKPYSAQIITDLDGMGKTDDSYQAKVTTTLIPIWSNDVIEK
jgi:hypothetical protein